MSPKQLRSDPSRIPAHAFRTSLECNSLPLGLSLLSGTDSWINDRNPSWRRLISLTNPSIEPTNESSWIDPWN